MKITSIQTTPKFYRSFFKLPDILREEAIDKKEIFMKNPFDTSLKTHKLDDGVILFHDIGDHRIYQ